MGRVWQENNPYVGQIDYNYEPGYLLSNVVFNGTRTNTITRDDNGNPVVIDPPGGLVIALTNDGRDALIGRETYLGGGTGTRVEEFERDENLNIVRHHIQNSGDHTTTFAYDGDNRLAAITNADGVVRTLAYAADGQLTSDAIGAGAVTRTFDAAGRCDSVAVDNGATNGFTYDNEGRLLTVTRYGSAIYAYTYDSAKRLATFADTTLLLGGNNTITYTPDAAGYGWERLYAPLSLTLVQEINDLNTVTKSTLDGVSVTYTLDQGVRPAAATRPTGLPSSAWAYNAHKEITGVTNGSGCAVTLTRDALTGFVTAREISLGSASINETFTHNNAGWITAEDRSGWQAAYDYRKDGVRTSFTLNNKTAIYGISAAGRVQSVLNAQLGQKLRAPLENDTVWQVGGSGGYSSIEAAVGAVYAAVGTNFFTAPQVVVVALTEYTNDVVVDSSLGGIQPTTNFPLIIRSQRDRVVDMKGRISIAGLSNVRLQGLSLSETNSAAAVTFADAPGAQVMSCVVLADTLITNCAGARVIGAYEYGIEATAADAAGRITNRTVAGRSYGYGYDAAGRLVSYSDSVDAANDAAYTYDHQGRRIRMVVGVEDHRCVYEGDDVSVEYVDGNGNGSLLDTGDYTRKYWLLPEIDQRIGFMDIDSTGTKTRYYYLTDQVGSVLQIVTTNGTVVNQYDYDAFGNIRWENSFEGVANRYTFHGREYDAERGDYYYRNRTYVPEWGSFTGPDMHLGNGIEGEPEGVGNYVFCRNDPVNNLDPLGLRAYGNDFVGPILEPYDWIEENYSQEEVCRVYSVLAKRDIHIFNPGQGNTAEDRETSRMLLERTLGVSVQLVWNPSFRRLGTETSKGGEKLGGYGWSWNPLKLLANTGGYVLEGTGAILDYGGLAADSVGSVLEKVPLLRKADPSGMHTKYLYNEALKYVMDQNNKDARVYGWMHSEGAMHGSLAMRELPEKQLRLIRAYTFGAGGYEFPSSKYLTLKHYGNVSKGNKVYDYVINYATGD